MNSEKPHIGTRIRLALDARDMRPSDLAARSGVSRAAVSSWLKGENLSLANINIIAKVLDVSLNWLVMGIGSVQLAADSDVSQEEQNLLRLLRHFGEDALSQSLGMVRATQEQAQDPLKCFKAYDLVSSTQLPVAVLDADGFLVYSNIYHNRLLGLENVDRLKLQSHHFTEWIPRVFHRPFRNLLQDTLRKGHATYRDLQITCPVNQVMRRFLIHTHAVSTPAGPGIHLLFKRIDDA